MRKEEPSNNVRLAATNALLNSLEFTKSNFDKEVSWFLYLLPVMSVHALHPLSAGLYPAGWDTMA